MGVVSLALGGSLTITSDLGASPTNLLSLTVSRATGIQLSIAVFLMFTFYVIVQAVLLKKEFKPIQLLQLLFAMIFGQFIGFFVAFFQLETDHLGIRFAMLFMGFLCLGIGVFLTVRSRLVPLPPEGMVAAVATRFSIDLGKAKNVVDVFLFSISVTLLLASRLAFVGIGIGTILSAIVVGRIVFLLNRFFNDWVERLLFDDKEMT